MTIKRLGFKAQLFFVSFLCLLLNSCSPYKQFIRVNPELAVCKNKIDTIAVFSDAIVAIEAKNDFYSEKSSYLLDSLILSGVQKSLKLKGYETKTINPMFLGSFMDSFQCVPIKRINSEQIEPIKLPHIFQNELSSSQLAAFERTCRRLYHQSIYNKSNQLSLEISNPIIKSDLDTLQSIIKCDNVLFVFHQAGLVDPSVTGAMLVGTLALTTILSGGMIIGYATKISVYHTYIMLLQLSTGNIVWSNYSSLDAAPVDAIFQVSKNNSKPLSAYINPDTLKRDILYRWHKNNLEAFPKKTDLKIFLGYKTKYQYPAQDFFKKAGTAPDFSDLSNSKFKNRIDSTIAAFSLSEDTMPEIPNDSIDYVLGKGRSIESLQPMMNTLMRYLEYAYYSRLRFKPDLDGDATIQFIITADGKARKIEFTESKLNDKILEYEIAKIIRSVNFGATGKKEGATLITRKLFFHFSKK